MKKPSITMRFGAAHNDITVDGITFDRDQLTDTARGRVKGWNADGRKFRRMLTAALDQAGTFGGGVR